MDLKELLEHYRKVMGFKDIDEALNNLVKENKKNG